MLSVHATRPPCARIVPLHQSASRPSTWLQRGIQRLSSLAKAPIVDCVLCLVYELTALQACRWRQSVAASAHSHLLMQPL